MNNKPKILVGLVLVLILNPVFSESIYHNVQDSKSWDWYPFHINVSDETGMEANQEDVRFFLHPEGTELWQYVNSNDTGWVEWVVNVTDITASTNKTIKMSWNEGNTTLKSDKTKVVYSHRDAEGGGSFADDWFCTEFSNSNYDCSAFSIASDFAYEGTYSYKLTDSDGGDYGGWLWVNETNDTITTDTQKENYMVEMWTRTDETTSYGGIKGSANGNIHYNNLTSGGLWDWTRAYLRYKTFSATTADLILSSFDDNVNTQVIDTTQDQFNEQEWYRIQLIRQGGLLNGTYMNESYFYQINLTSAPTTEVWGLSGVWAKTDGSETGAYWFDDWSVKPYSLDATVYENVTAPDSFGVTANTTSPNIFDSVSFYTTEGDTFNITNYWWNFTDGNNTFHTTLNSTTHAFNSRGEHNVTVIGLNESGTNYTAYILIDVNEPTVEIWAQDVLTSSFLANFTVNVTNSTDSGEITASGYFAKWNMTELPYGDVNLTILLDSYNHTTSSFNINNTVDINRTELLYPSAIYVYPRDAQYPNVTVPVTLELNNVTNVANEESSLDVQKIDVDVSCTDPACNDASNTSLEYYASVVKVSVSCSTSTASDNAKSSLVMKGADGDTKTVYYAYCEDGNASATNTRIIYTTPSGYEVRETDGTLESSSSDQPIWPIRFYMVTTAHAAGGGSSDASGDAFFMTDYFEFTPLEIQGLTYLTGEQKTGTPFSYLDLTYLDQYLAYDISGYPIINSTMYFYYSSTGVTQTVYVVDDNNEPIEDVYVTAYGTVGNDYVLVSSDFTDGSGRADLTLYDGQQYDITVGKTGYTSESLTISASSNAIYVALTESITSFASPFSGVSLSLEVTDPIYQNSTATINYTITDSSAALLNFTLTVYEDGDLNFTETKTTSSGGLINTSLGISETSTSTYVVSIEFWRIYEGEAYQFVYNETHTVNYYGGVSKAAEIIQDNFDWTTKAFFGIIILAMAFSAHPIIGIVATLLLLLANLIDMGLTIVIVLAGIVGMVMFT